MTLSTLTGTLKRTKLVTLYQTNEGICSLTHKVLLVDQGRRISYDPANAAKGYFIDLGFECPPPENIGRFFSLPQVGIQIPPKRLTSSNLPSGRTISTSRLWMTTLLSTANSRNRIRWMRENLKIQGISNAYPCPPGIELYGIICQAGCCLYEACVLVPQGA